MTQNNALFPEELKPTSSEEKTIQEVTLKLQDLLKLNDLVIIPSTILTGEGGIIHKIELIPNRIVRLSRKLAEKRQKELLEEQKLAAINNG